MLLIGSKAIKSHFPDFPRDPKDIDWAVDKEMKGTQNQEFLYNPIIGHLRGIASPDILLTLKISHAIGWDVNWDKHIFDIQFLISKSAKLDYDLFQKLL